MFLIVEKDPLIRDVERELVALGYRVDFLDDGERAHVRARELNPDLLATEILLLKLDGLEVIRRLRADPETMAIPVLAFSVLAAEKQALTAGATAFLRRPVRKKQFLVAVETLLNGSRARSGSIAERTTAACADIEQAAGQGCSAAPGGTRCPAGRSAQRRSGGLSRSFVQSHRRLL